LKEKVEKKEKEAKRKKREKELYRVLFKKSE